MILLKYFVIFLLMKQVAASLGDRLVVYQNLVRICFRNNCSSPDLLKNFYSNQAFYMRLLKWDCFSECQFESQWKTIERLRLQKVYDIPQFHGKWTFYRLYGIQEPASFFFSILNFLANFHGWTRFKKKVIKRNTNSNYNVWRVQAFLALNAWFWSAIYHARDTPFTEKLDYFSAYLVIIYSLYAITFKLILPVFVFLETYYFYVTIPFFAFYIYHIRYLYWTHFDYGYNMKVNVITGVTSTILWLGWCFWYRKHRPFVWKAVFGLSLLNVSALLELFDFSPIGHVFDSHSIWHLLTIPFPFIWYDFLIDDTLSLNFPKNSDQIDLIESKKEK